MKNFDQTIKSLARTRRPSWKDLRPRSPKALNDLSGIILRGGVSSPGGNGIQDLDYDLLTEVYLTNDLAWTCIDLVSSTVALGRLVVRKRTAKGVEYLPNHPLQKLLDFPDASMTQYDLLQSYVCHQLLFGTVSLMLLREGMTESCDVCIDEGEEDCKHKLYVNNTGKVVQIRTIHPSLLEQKTFMFEGVTKTLFVYKPASDYRGEGYLIHPDNIITDPIYNPAVGWYGVSPTHLLQRWLDLDKIKTHQISEFFKNGAIPSLLVTLNPPTDGSAYTDEPQTVLEMLKENWMKKFSHGGNAEKTPAFLYGDVTVEKLQQSVTEMISKELYFEITSRVCATYGVPANLYEFGLKYASQRASAEELEKAFYSRTISQNLTRIKQKLTNLILPAFGDPELELEWDLSQIGAANYIIQSVETKVLKRWELGLTDRDTTLAALSLPTVGGEEGEEYYRRTVMSDGNNNVSATPKLDNKLQIEEIQDAKP